MQSFGKPWLCVPPSPGRHLHKYFLHTNKSVYTEVEKERKNLKPLHRSQAPALQLLQYVIIEIITEITVLKEKENKHILLNADRFTLWGFTGVFNSLAELEAEYF